MKSLVFLVLLHIFCQAVHVSRGEDENVNCADKCESDKETCIIIGDKLKCICIEGYTRDANDKNCRAITCEDNPCGITSRCTDIDGVAYNPVTHKPRLAYSCECDQTHYGNGYMCYDSPCYSCPCRNGGTCSKNDKLSQEDSEFKCSCPIGFEGARCDSRVLPCDTRINSIECSSGCVCASLGSGDVCECVDIADETISCGANPVSCNTVNPCNEHGTCYTFGKEQVCKCDNGYIGLHCQKKIEDMCPHNKICELVSEISGRVSQRCRCVDDDFEGDDCKDTTLICDDDAPDDDVCLNGGNCIPSKSNKPFDKCNCKPGFGGRFCGLRDDHSYIDFPRIHFAGVLLVDPCTVNNFRANYDTEAFTPQILRNPDLSGWNPDGSGDWHLVNAHVTRVCLPIGECKTLENDDAVINKNITDNGSGARAKTVIFDPDAVMATEVYGWTLQVGDFFKGNFLPAAFQYRWSRDRFPTEFEQSQSKGAASFQSVLTNVQFGSKSSESNIVSYFKKHSGLKRELSIRFNLFRYEANKTKENFTHVHIVGSIGLSGPKASPFFTRGRMLKPMNKWDGSFAPFVFRKKTNDLLVDLSNTFQIDNYGNLLNVERLGLGLMKLEATKPINGSNYDKETDENPTCALQQRWITEDLIGDMRFGSYSQNTGIFHVRVIDSETAKQLNHNFRLFIAQLDTMGNCEKVILAEDVFGINMHPFSRWSVSEQPDKSVIVKMFFTHFGKPKPNHSNLDVKVTASNVMLEGVDDNDKRGFLDKPAVVTCDGNDDNGIFCITFETEDPKNARVHIDGQLYGYQYHYKGIGASDDEFVAANAAIVILVWDKFIIPSRPNWVRHVRPIFQQYANLFPVMKRFVDLGDYSEVVRYKKALVRSMTLPENDPNFMPVTRDLSPKKTSMIVTWLKAEHPEHGMFNFGADVDTLKYLLQVAIQLEHATIPPYLSGYLSIKKGYNTETRKILTEVLIDEMIHMAQDSNILNAIGGNPNLFSPGFVIPYPSYLPGGVHSSLEITVNKVSIFQIHEVYMAIEEPFKQLTQNPLMRTIDEIINHLLVSQSDAERATTTISTKACRDLQDRYMELLTAYGGIRINRDTIGELYVIILVVLSKLECEEALKWNHVKKAQVENIRGIVKVVDYESAVRGIMKIITEGEGSSPCNPLEANDTTSHYFKFASIVNGNHVVEIKEDTSKARKTKTPRGVMERDTIKDCDGVFAYHGEAIYFYDDGVWPVVENPQMSMYREGSKAYYAAKEFNQSYTNLLRSLQNVFDGNVAILRDSLALMKEVQLYGERLVQIPIAEDGDPNIGPNAGPVYPSYP